LPENRRGIALGGIIHITDWWSTLSYIAGQDSNDDLAKSSNLPPPDSINMFD